MYWDNFNIFYNNLQKILFKNSFILKKNWTKKHAIFV